MGRILICGAGQGGHALAGYLSLVGNEVILYTTNREKEIKFNGNANLLEITGIIEGKTRLHKVTSDLERAMADQDYIFIVTNATAHQYYAKKMAKYLSGQDIILISPGIGGAMSFAHEVRKYNPQENISVTETDTLVYACKVPEIGHSHIKSAKREILYATIPSWHQSRVSGFIEEVYPQFIDAHNPLMGLDDSPALHIVGMIKNHHRILNAEDFNFYIEGITPEIADYMWEMDQERCRVAEAMGIKPRNIADWLHLAYGVKKGGLFDMIQNTPPYKNAPENPNRSPAPKTVYHRYLLEEVPLRAVPTVSIAGILKIETPKYREMIDLASEITGIDFWKCGRTIEDMGLTVKDILNWSKEYKWRQ